MLLTGGMYLTMVSGQAATWSIGIVAGNGGVDAGRWSISLALDSTGRPHVAYRNATNTALDHAYWDGTQWIIETVYSMGDAGRYVSLKLDANGRAHVSFLSGTDLGYANNTSGSWVTQPNVDVPGTTGWYTSLALKDGLCPRISYYDLTNTALKYASLEGGTWVKTVVDNSADDGQYSSLALDSQGYPHISYFDASSQDLKHAWWDGSVWENETVDSDGNVGMYTSIAIDTASGRIHVSYTNGTGVYKLKHAVKEGSTWTTETVDAGPDVGLHTSIALDPSGLPRISYYDFGNGMLKLATSNGLTWTTETVDDGGYVNDVGQYTSLGIDSYGNPQIAYWDFDNNDVKYAKAYIDYIDLSVSSSDLSFNPIPPIDPGTSVTVNATIHNNGNLNASNVLVRFYDGAPVPANQIDGDKFILLIANRSAQTVSVPWIAQPMGEHLINVVVDPDDTIPELSEANNRATQRVIVKGPDLALRPQGISWSPPGNASLSSTLQFSANVSNIGDVDASSIVVRFWDGAPGGTQIDLDQTIPVIPAGGNQTATVPWTAQPLGTHQICVQTDPDRLIAEMNESNNDACASLFVTLPDPAVAPGDLVASPPGPVAEDSSVALDLTVRDIGGLPAINLTASLYDGRPGSGLEILIGNRSTSSLGPGVSWLPTWTWRANGTGNHTFYVVLDGAGTITELSESNNEVNTTIEVTGLSDLVTQSFTAIPSGPVVVGSPVTLNATWANRGNGTATASFTMYEDLDSNSKPDPGEQLALWRLTLAGWNNQSETYAWTSLIVGSHSLCALADAFDEVTETAENNNQICIGVDVAAKPDLAPVNPLPAPPIKAGTGEVMQLSLQVRNQGGSSSGSFVVAFYNQTSPSTPFATFNVLGLGVNEESSRVTASWPAPATPGIFTVFAKVDDSSAVDEADETNNVQLFQINVTNFPRTTLRIGDPNYTSTMVFIISVTPLRLDAVDFSGTGIKQTLYQVDSGMWMTYLSPFFLPIEGIHTVEYYSEDNLGNIELPSTTTLAVDDTPPTTTVQLGTPNYQVGGLWIDSTTTVSLLAADNPALHAGVNRTDYRIWDGTVWSAWQSYIMPLTFPSEGSYAVEFRSVDQLGNVEPTASMAFKVDSTPSDVTTAVGTPNYRTGPTSPWFVTPATTVDASANDPGTSAVGVLSLEYQVDGGAWNPLAAPLAITQEGAHTIQFRATDKLGHASATTTVSIIVDGIPPSENVLVGDPKYVAATTWLTSTTLLTIEATDGGSSPVGVDRIRWRSWSGSWTTWTDYLAPFPLGLPEGQRYVEVEASDLLGNSGSALNVSLVVDDTAPTGGFTISGPRHTAPDSTVFVASTTSFSIDANDGGAGASGLSAVEYRVDSFGWTPYTAPFDLAAMSDGQHTIAYRVSDNLGHSSSDTFDIILDRSPPSTEYAASVKPGSGTFWLNATDAGAGVNNTYYSIDSGTLQVYTGPVSLGPGDYTLKFYSDDNVTNVESEKTESLSVEEAGGGGGVVPVEEANIAPAVAGVLAVLLLLIAVFVARRRSKTAMMAGVLVTIAEAASGLASSVVTQLRIPPWAGAGLAVFVLLFLLGLIVVLWLIRSEKRHEAEVAPENEESGKDLEDDRAEKDENESSEEESDKS